MIRDVEATCAYYSDLLLYQYVNLPKARAHIAALAGAAICDFVAFQVKDAFDLDTAVGDQLDVLGQYIGFDRRIPLVIDRPYWRLADYTTYDPGTPLEGLTDYTDASVNSDSVFYRYFMADQATQDLEDEEYRFLLKLKALVNTSDHSLASIVEVLYSFFGTGISLVDNCDMTMVYTVQPGASRLVQLAVSQGLLPKPAGVGITIVYA
jgi:hypothetical protein